MKLVLRIVAWGCIAAVAVWLFTYIQSAAHEQGVNSGWGIVYDNPMKKKR